MDKVLQESKRWEEEHSSFIDKDPEAVYISSVAKILVKGMNPPIGVGIFYKNQIMNFILFYAITYGKK